MPLIVNGGIVLAMTSRSMLSCVTHTRRPTLTNSRFFRFSRHSRKVGSRNCNCCAAVAKGTKHLTIRRSLGLPLLTQHPFTFENSACQQVICIFRGEMEVVKDIVCPAAESDKKT